MNARAAPWIGVVVSLALVRAGPSHALSLRSSEAEAFLGDALPGTAVSSSPGGGKVLRVTNTGPKRIRVEFQAVSPPRGTLKDGYDPWPYPDRVRLRASATELSPGESAEPGLAVTVPKSKALLGGQYEIDLHATGRDAAGASLTMNTRTLLSVGPPPAGARDAPEGGWTERPGFVLSPESARETVRWGRASGPGGGVTTVKLIDAGEEDLRVVLRPARDWDASVRLEPGEEPAPNPHWLRPEPGAVEVRAGAIGRARIEVSVPREERYAGRRWAFVVAADATAGGRTTRRWFVLHVTTPDWEEHTRAP
jgi:hypothetical protein